jgi:putative ABC transport system permease protein
VLFAASALSILRAIDPSGFAALPGIERLGLDFRVLAAAFLFALLTGAIFGAVPAFAASDRRVGGALIEESRGSSGSLRARRLRAGLVIAELALSVVLLTGAGLLLVSFDRLSAVAPGFRADQLAVTRLTIPAARYGAPGKAVAFFDDLFARLQRAPGVQSVAATSAPPFGGPDSRLNLTIERRPDDGSGPVRAHPRLVSSGYFATMGIPLIRGRRFNDADASGTTKVAIINEAAVRRFWPDEDPLGQRISLGDPANWMAIVGVVGDVRHSGLDADANPEAYIPQRQGFDALGAGLGRSLTVIIRTAADIPSTASSLRSVLQQIDPQLPVGAVQSMDQLIAESVAPRRLNLVLVAVFACVAVTLTAAGLFGVMSHLVAQRRREIGVRIALGASRRQVLALVIRQAGVMTGAGLAAGLAGAFALTRSMRSMLFAVSAADPRVYLGVSLLLVVVAFAAVIVPSSRASRVDPLTALRE